MARGVFQNWLDRIGTAVMDGDYPTYADAVSLPFTLITKNATMTISKSDDLKNGFDSYRVTLNELGATHMVRVASGVTEMGRRLMIGNYTTHILSDIKPVVPPFVSSMTLRLEQGAWRATTIVNSLDDNRWPLDLPQGDTI